MSASASRPLARHTVRLRPDDHELARRLAFEARVPIGDVIGEGLQQLRREREERQRRETRKAASA